MQCKNLKQLIILHKCKFCFLMKFLKMFALSVRKMPDFISSHNL